MIIYFQNIKSFLSPLLFQKEVKNLPKMTSSQQPSSSTQQQYLGDLEKCGIATENNLRELLTTCPDPVEGIRNFQQTNSIQLPSLTPVMKLLDLHGIRRTEYHETVISELTDRMTSKLRALGEKKTAENVHKLEQHLEQCFKLYRVPRIRPIVLETLAQLPKVADRYLKLIICDKEFYDQCAVSVKQQIWLKNESLFMEAVEPVLDAYIQEKEQQLVHWAGGGSGVGAGGGTDSNPKQQQHHHQKQPPPQQTQMMMTNYFTSDTWKGRRQKKHIQELVTMVGQRELLYTRLIDIIRDRFISTDNPHYCSIRFELLMAAHDVSMEFLVRVDPCHDFAWCLDACSKHIRAKLIDAQQMSKLKTLLEAAAKKGPNKTLAEMAMIAGDPHILHMIASVAMKTIRDNAANPNAAKPRELHSLQLLIKILLMGLHVKELLMGQTTLQELLDPQLFTMFLAAFSTMFVQDITRNELAIAPDEVVEQYVAERELRPRHASLDPFLVSSPLCALLWLHHLVMSDALLPISMAGPKRRPFDAAHAMRYLDILPQLTNQFPLGHPHWAHLFTHRLLHCPSVFSSDVGANLLIRRLFVPQLNNFRHTKFHLLHLLAQHSAIIPPDLFLLAANALFEMATEDTMDGGGETMNNFYIELEKYKGQLGPLRDQLMRERKKDEEEEGGMKMMIMEEGEEEKKKMVEDKQEDDEGEVKEEEEQRKKDEEEELKIEEEKRKKDEEEELKMEEEKRKVEEMRKRKEEQKRKMKIEKKPEKGLISDDLEDGEIEEDEDDE